MTSTEHYGQKREAEHRQKELTAKLDAFAFELLTFLSMGRALQASQGGGRGVRPGTVASLSAVQ